jgi:hypothetical protein
MAYGNLTEEKTEKNDILSQILNETWLEESKDNEMGLK